MLPQSKPKTHVVQLSGGPVEVRGLTIEEVRACRQLGTTEEADAQWIHYATGNPVDHILLWIRGGQDPDGATVVPASAGDVTLLLSAVWDASGMTEAARFQSRAVDDADHAPTAGGS